MQFADGMILVYIQAVYVHVLRIRAKEATSNNNAASASQACTNYAYAGSNEQSIHRPPPVKSSPGCWLLQLGTCQANQIKAVNATHK